MARPSLGKSARTVIKSVRLTEHESAILTEKYGSAGKAIRTLINAEVKKIKESK